MVEEEMTADEDKIDDDEPTGETTGEDWLEVRGTEIEGLELAVLDAVDDGVTAGGV